MNLPEKEQLKQKLFDIKNSQYYFESYFNCSVKIGFELEFYLEAKENISAEQFNIIKSPEEFYIATEDGPNQFEIVTKEKDNVAEALLGLLKAINKLENLAINNNWRVDFSSVKEGTLPPNSLHATITLTKNSKQLFYKNSNGPSNELLYVIQGILAVTKEHPEVILPTENCKRRLSSSNIYVPKKLCWGYNNRTTAIRIITNKDETCRLEYRLPSSEADLFAVTELVLQGCKIGLAEKQLPSAPVYGRASDIQYEYEEIKELL